MYKMQMALHLGSKFGYGGTGQEEVGHQQVAEKKPS
jgi:hypothetical protein